MSNRIKRKNTKLKVEDSDRLALMLMIHFPHFDGENEAELVCENCQDFKIGVCDGQGRKGDQVMECMLTHSNSGEWGEIG